MTTTRLNEPTTLAELSALSTDGIHVEVWKVVKKVMVAEPGGPLQERISAAYSVCLFDHGLNKATHTRANGRTECTKGLHTFLSRKDAIAWGCVRGFHVILVRCTARLADYIAGGETIALFNTYIAGQARAYTHVCRVAVFNELWIHLDKMEYPERLVRELEKE